MPDADLVSADSLPARRAGTSAEVPLGASRLRRVILARCSTCGVPSGPYAGRVLTDLGADVVKLEPPDGNMTR
jgi:hypothetical protein